MIIRGANKLFPPFFWVGRKPSAPIANKGYSLQGVGAPFGLVPMRRWWAGAEVFLHCAKTIVPRSLMAIPIRLCWAVGPHGPRESRYGCAGRLAPMARGNLAAGSPDTVVLGGWPPWPEGIPIRVLGGWEVALYPSGGPQQGQNGDSLQLTRLAIGLGGSSLATQIAGILLSPLLPLSG